MASIIHRIDCWNWKKNEMKEGMKYNNKGVSKHLDTPLCNNMLIIIVG